MTMLKKKKHIYVGITLLGLLLVLSGIFAEGLWGESRYLGFASGLGCSMIAIGVLNVYVIEKKPEAVKSQEINEKDERFVKLREKSAYATYYVTLFSMAAVEVSFLFMDYLIPCFVVIGLMVLQTASFLFFMRRYGKQM